MSDIVRKVLLVDDDPAILRLVGLWLRKAGYDVREVESVRDAIASIEAQVPDFVITDWEMPVEDGLALCRWIRAQSFPRYVYTLIQTIRGATQDVVQGLESGADDYIRKPANKDELLARLRSAERFLELEARLSQMAKIDALTGLNTRRTFYELAEREWARSTRHLIPLSCAMLDIDFFKRINDTYGHPVGDEAIRQVSRCLAESVRSSDVVARYGGEEFCVLLPETDEMQAFLWAERTREKIGRLVIPAGEINLSLACSFGVAQRLADTKSTEELVEMADQALLVAKNSGRNRVVQHRNINRSLVEESGEFSPEKLFRGLQAREVMTAIVAGLQADETVGSAMQFFLRFRISSAPVVDQTGHLIGILSEKDLMAIMLLPNWWRTPIRDVMKTNVVCYDETIPALTIYQFLCRVSIRTAVIVKDGRPTGLINRSSLLRWFANTLAACDKRLNATSADATHDADEVQVPRTKEHLLSITQAMIDETKRIQDRFADADCEVMTCTVGGASRIQELVNDMLINCRYAAEQTNQKSGDEPGQVFGLAGFLEALSGQDLAELQGAILRPSTGD